ncbi:MAG TPA: DUF559 domain-containing protein [Egibacteraceae bacterium]|nr:DUF559 domain-containing protein [Egibacteraceae bacterium]
MDTAAKREALSTASGQRGLLARRQALSSGMTRHQLATELDCRRWEEAQPQVYRVLGTPPSWEGDLLACCLTAEEQDDRPGQAPRLVVSHASAAALLGLDRVANRETVEVTGVGTSLPVLWHVTVHRTRSLARCDVTVIDGMPVTAGPRTLVDLAGRLSETERTALTDDAVCSKAAPRRWLYRRASALANGRAGVHTYVRLTRPEAEAEFWSWLERHAAGRVREFGLPQPLWNHPLRVAGRLLGVVDSFWAEVGLPVEWDGLRFHSTPAQRRRDQARDRRMTIAGYPPLRYTWSDLVEDPEGVMGQIAEALRARGMRW